MKDYFSLRFAMTKKTQFGMFEILIFEIAL